MLLPLASIRVRAGAENVLHHQRQEEWWGGEVDRPAEVLGSHTHDFERMSVQGDHPSKDPRIRAEASFPIAVAEYRDRMRARAAVLDARYERPAEGRLNTIGLEEVRRDEHPHGALVASLCRDRKGLEIPGRDTFEDIGGPIAQVLIVRYGDGSELQTGPFSIDLDQRVGIFRPLEWAKEDSVDRRERRGIEPDTERQCRHGRQGEHWALPQHPNTEDYVPPHIIHHPRHPSLVVPTWLREPDRGHEVSQ